MWLFRHRHEIACFTLLASLFFSGNAFGQSDPDVLRPFLGDEILAPGVALLQIKSYILSRVAPPPTPVSAQQWTEEAQRPAAALVARRGISRLAP